MSGYNETITDAWLRVAPPKDIYDWLERRSRDRDIFVRSKADRSKADKCETTLLSRNDPLIDLGLASFGISIKVAKILFFLKNDRTQPDHPCKKALSLAILRNGALSKAYYQGLPAALFKDNEFDEVSEKTAA